jgi:hypothetical protein
MQKHIIAPPVFLHSIYNAIHGGSFSNLVAASPPWQPQDRCPKIVMAAIPESDNTKDNAISHYLILLVEIMRFCIIILPPPSAAAVV